MRAVAVCFLFLGGCGLSVVGVAADRSASDASPDPNISLDSAAPSDADASDADAPSLHYVRADAPASVDLTSEGTLDWIHWGARATAPHSNRKAGVTPLAFDYAPAGQAPASIGPSTNNPSSFSWSDGTPAAVETGTSTHVFFKGTANATVQLAVATSMTTRTARFYLALNRTRARFAVDFDDGSVPVSSEENERNDGALPFVFTVTYRHPSPSVRLRVRWTMLTVLDPNNSTVRISAVSVQ